jgi:hypothetical protein
MVARREAVMTRLDLRKDFADLLAFVSERVRTFDPKTNDGPGKGLGVTRIDIAYQCDQAGWVALVFDTRRGAGPDGQWNSHIKGNTLERPDWQAAFEALEGGSLLVVLHDGKERIFRRGSYDGLTTILGDLLKAVLLQARADGIFAGLSKAPRCELGVEEHDGAYGWPVYEERGRENLA